MEEGFGKKTPKCRHSGYYEESLFEKGFFTAIGMTGTRYFFVVVMADSPEKNKEGNFGGAVKPLTV